MKSDIREVRMDNLSELILQTIRELNPIKQVADIAARDEDKTTLTSDALYIVTDATGDSTVESGAALYFYSRGSDVFSKVSEYESLDVVTRWENVEDKPESTKEAIDDAVAKIHSHANFAVLSEIGEGADGIPTYKGGTLKGEQGDRGFKGDKGDQGEQGVQGLPGATGATGLKGDKGDTGATGLKGDQGNQGIQGVQGVKGDQGIQGLKGDKGDTGLTGPAGANAVGGYSPSNPVPLQASGTPAFAPVDRGAAPSSWRAIGPSMAATTTPLSYSAARVPIRPAFVASGSTHIGSTVVLYQINRANSIIVKKVTQVVTQDVTELTFTGPFTVPAGQEHAFAVGVPGGAWNAHTDIFYGNSTAYVAPYASQTSGYADTDMTLNEGGSYSLNFGTSNYRAVLLDPAGNVVKGVVGPLDIADLPTHSHAISGVTGLQAALDGKAAGPIYLSTTGTTVTRSPAASTVSAFGSRMFGSFTPTSNYVMQGLKDTVQDVTVQLRAQVFRISDGVLMGQSGYVSKVNGAHTAVFSSTITLLAGVAYLIGWTASTANVLGSTVAATWSGFNVGGTGYYGSAETVAPYQSAGGYYTTFDILGPTNVKNVTGPIDTADMPAINLSSGFTATTVAPSPGGNSTGVSIMSIYWSFTPTVDFILGGIEDANQPTSTLQSLVWKVGTTGAPIASSANVTKVGGKHTATYTSPPTLLAGQTYYIGWRSATTSAPVSWVVSTTAQSYSGFTGTVTGIVYDTSSTANAYPTTTSTGYTPTFSLIKAANVRTKNVTGPVDLTDLPTHTHAIADVTGLQTALDTKLDTEGAQDMIATFVNVGSGLIKNYDDTNNTFTLTATGTPGPGYIDIIDSLSGAVVDGVAASFYLPRAVSYSKFKAFLGTTQATNLTLTLASAGTTKATLVIPANTASAELTQAISIGADELVTITVSGSGGAQTLRYYLQGLA